jgi:DHA1 family bicyclomycin/chloramphenicol resistance-like MFS transporter
LLSPETGAYPVLWLMFITAIGSVIAILSVLRRNRLLGVDAK